MGHAPGVVYLSIVRQNSTNNCLNVMSLITAEISFETQCLQIGRRPGVIVDAVTIKAFVRFRVLCLSLRQHRDFTSGEIYCAKEKREGPTDDGSIAE